MQYYDSLLDQDPYFQEQKALERALGRTEGITEAIQAFQNTVVEIPRDAQRGGRDVKWVLEAQGMQSRGS